MPSKEDSSQDQSTSSEPFSAPFSNEELGTFQTLVDIVAKLRAPGGCPWDREQTRQTMKRYVMEECFELIDAMESDEPREIAEEIGDVAFNLAFQIQMAKENGEFEESAVFGTVVEKLTRRHPHVFGDVEASTSDEVLANWRQIKKMKTACHLTMSWILSWKLILKKISHRHRSSRLAMMRWWWIESSAWLIATSTNAGRPLQA